MAYENMGAHLKPTGAHLVNDVLTSNGVINTWTVQRPCFVKRLAFVIETLMSSSGNTQLAFKKYSVHGNSSSTVTTLGTLIIPTATAAGKVVYKNITPVSLKPGEELVAEVTVASTSAGKGATIVEVADDPETPANNTNYVASA